MASFNPDVVLSVIAAVVAFIVGLATRSKLNSESANEISQAVAHLIPPLRESIESLKSEVDEYRQRVQVAENRVDVLENEMGQVKAENRDLLRGIRILIQQFQELDVTPRWMPDFDGWED